MAEGPEGVAVVPVEPVLVARMRGRQPALGTEGTGIDKVVGVAKGCPLAGGD